MRFVKAHTNGNDFVITSESFCLDDIRFLSNRRYGIGFDQFIFVSPEPHGSYTISFFNQDGSYAKMCGNGLLAVTSYIKSFLEKDKNRFSLNVDNRDYKSSIENNVVSIELPLPKLIEEFDNVKLISTGNFHLIYKVDDLSEINDDFAKELQSSYMDYNIHFLKQIADNSIRIKSFERGVGWTKACGSGAIASAFSTNWSGKVSVIHDGGPSEVFIEKDSIIFKAIPTVVFSGETL